jgi:hypothetical protein
VTALLKIVLTPGLIAVATLLERRWGPGIGGAFAGLPLTSAPVSLFLALEQGPEFAAEAAGGTLLGLLSQGAVCLVYSWLARRTIWWMCTVASVAAFAGVTWILGQVSLPVWAAFGVVCTLLVLIAAAIPATPPTIAPAHRPRWDLPARMLVATGIVITLTSAAGRLGPTWTGLLSPFPVFALVLGVFTHRAQGPGAAARLLRGIVLGSLAHAAMFVLLASLLVRWSLAWTYALASIAALAVNGLALFLARDKATSDRA